MAASSCIGSQQFSRLLKLPREIRDLIYEHALVREVIPIETAVINVAASTTHRSPGFRNGLKKKFPSKYPRYHRRVWTVPAFDVDVDFSEYDIASDPKQVQMTYQLGNPSKASNNYGIEIRLLRTCKQIFHEASEVFYGKNTFSFLGDYSVAAAFAFLCDRPPKMLLLIPSVRLGLTENNNMRGTTGAHYPVMRRATDSLVLQYTHNHFTDLCTLLATSRMNLKELSLVITTPARYYGDRPTNLEECLTWETIKTDSARPWHPAWIDPLLKIQGLKRLKMNWLLERPRLQRMADTTSLMRQHMIRKCGSSLQNSATSTSRSEPMFWMHYPDACKSKIGKASYDSRTDVLEGYGVNEDGTWTPVSGQSYVEEMETIASDFESLDRNISITIAELYVCCCELKAG